MAHGVEFSGNRREHIADGRANRSSTGKSCGHDWPLATALDDIAEVPFFKKALEHNRYDEFWKDDSLTDRYGDIRVPALFVTGWYDVLLHETVQMFQGYAANAGSEEARSKSKLIIGPWHSGNLGSGLPAGDVDFGPDSGLDLAADVGREHRAAARDRGGRSGSAFHPAAG